MEQNTNTAIETTPLTDPEERRVKVLRLCAQGVSYREIAKRVGVSLGTISRDVRLARETWRNIAAEHYEEHVATALAEIDTAKAETYAAWQRSIGEVVTETTTRGEKGKSRTVRVTTSAGDPRYLVVIERLIEQRIRLLGTLKGEQAGGRTLAEFLEIGRKGVRVDYYERRISAQSTE